MSKTTQIKEPVVHKKETIQHTEKAWEHEHGHHVESNETHSKSRFHKHFPAHRWAKPQENKKGPKV